MMAPLSKKKTLLDDRSTLRGTGTFPGGESADRLPARRFGSPDGWLRGHIRRGQVLLFVERVAAAAALIGLWQLLVSAHVINPLVSRSPEQVAKATIDLLGGDSGFWHHMYSTMTAMLIALAASSVFGIVIGIGLGLAPKVEAVVDPFVSAFNSMPRVALAPFFIIYFGIGQMSKIALAFSIVAVVMLVSANAGIKSVDRDILTLSSAMNVRRRQLFFKIMLPSAIPSIFGGLRLGVVYSLLGVVTSEILASKAGIGQLIARDSGVFNMQYVYAEIFVLMIVGVVINLAMTAVERRLLRWQRA
jgi:NitT/TauT family transport system permease protein